MKGLGADVQRFLAEEYRNVGAEALDNDDSAAQLRRSSAGSYGGRRSYETRSHGIVWAMAGEERGDLLRAQGWPHAVTWAQLKRHRDGQPAHLRQALSEALAALTAEHVQHWEAMSAINSRWYADASPEVRAQLDEESQRHWSAESALSADVGAAVRAMLPLATDEPTDLIEWAEALL